VAPGGEQETSLLRLEIDVEGLDNTIVVNVWLLRGQRDTIWQARYEADVLRRDADTQSVEVAMEPFPHTVRHYKKSEDEPRVEATALSMVRRNGVNTQINCKAGSWPALRPAFERMVLSRVAVVAEWPPHPPELERESRDGFVYFAHPAVKASDVKELRSFLRLRARRFEQLHGKPSWDPDNPPLVVIHNTLAEARGLFDGIQEARHGVALDSRGGRIFVTPLRPGDNTGRAMCARTLTLLLYEQQYGSYDPFWLYVGEGNAAWSEEMTGRKAPQVTEGLADDLPTTPLTLGGVLGMEAEGKHTNDAYVSSATAYTLFFREGPSRYRKAFAAFKEEYGATRDAKACMERHLLSLDQVAMAADLRRWIRTSITVAKHK
jgi:hypothetical protein